MPSDWTNFTPSNIPKNQNNVENRDTSVPPDSEISGAPTEITMGPKKVFKTGYPTGKTVDTAGGGIYGTKTTKELGVKMQIRPLVASRDVQLLGVHGVADAVQVQEILHPKDQSVMESIVRQEAFVVTKDCKVVDIAASEWPINLEVAPDVRSVLKHSVRYGEEIGIVEGSTGDCAFFKSPSASEASVVPIQDLEPVMITKADMSIEDMPKDWLADDASFKWINVYFTQRQYGGPEEGGWYYDNRELQDSRQANSREEAEQIQSQLTEQYGEAQDKELSSVLGRGTYEIVIEDEKGESETQARPHYE